MSSVPGRIREGMLLLSGDVLLLFNPLLIDWNGSGAAVISFKENAETGKNHGVFLKGDNGNVKSFLHKQTVEKLTSVGAVNENGMVDIDTGAILFGTDLISSLYTLISTDGKFDEEKYREFVNEKVRLSLYGDFQYPLAEDSSLEQFYHEKPEGDFCDELTACRKAVWDVLRPFRIKLLRLAPAKFIHFGTTKEILALMSGGVKDYAELGWSSITNSSANKPSYNSIISLNANVGRNVYAEVSYIHSTATIGDGCVLSYIDIHDEEIPPNLVLHGLKQSNGYFVCRIYSVYDNPKENKLFGKVIPEEWGTTLWDAPIYPERKNIREAISAALRLYELVQANCWSEIEPGKSLADGFNDADSEAILAWEQRMKELVAMNRISDLIEKHEPATKGEPLSSLTSVQKMWLSDQLAKSDFSRRMRLHYYIGKALGGTEGELMVTKAFRILSSAILEETLSGLQENKSARIHKDVAEVELPLRVNWGGGWSDTPPYCNENGGTVLNAAILLNKKRPVSVRIRRIKELKIIFESSDMDVYDEFTDLSALQSVGDPFDSFVLQKAALLACGILPAAGGNLEETLVRLGGGFIMNTEVIGVPKGSGLGTSSILAAACVKAIFEFIGKEYTEENLYDTVLCMEQIMSTGGGWQDQVGGVTDGIKYISSRAGLNQKLKVEHITLPAETMAELNDRFALIYTGQRRLARNLLRDVVGRYIGNEPDALFALNEIQRTAALMRFELERSHVDEFAKLLSDHWELSKMIDAGSTNTLIDQIFDSVEDLIDGKMVCGAGGGGFLQVIMKKGISKADLQKRLKSIFADTDINVWDCMLL